MDTGSGTGNDGTQQRDELVIHLLGVRSDAISTIRRAELALAELGRPVRPAVVTRREKRLTTDNGGAGRE